MPQRYGEKYCLKPTAEQAEMFSHYFKATRYVYNYMRWEQEKIKNNISGFYWIISLASCIRSEGLSALCFLKVLIYSKPRKKDLPKAVYEDVMDIKSGYQYLSKFDQYKCLTELKKQPGFEFLNEVETKVLRVASDNLRKSIDRYLDKKLVNAKFPRYKKFVSTQSFMLNYDSVDELKKHLIVKDGVHYIDLKIKQKGNRKKSGKLPVIRVRYIQHRLPREFSSGVVTVSKTATTYAISFSTLENLDVADVPINKKVGIDRNTANVLVLSDQYKGRHNKFFIARNKKGEPITEKLQKRMKKLQQDLSRKYDKNKKKTEQSQNYLTLLNINEKILY